MFVPGDNAPAFGFVAEDGLAPGAMSVGGYQSRESYRLNNGFVPEKDDNLHWGALSHGPSGSGALKPDLLAPSGQMSTEVGYRKGAEQTGPLPAASRLLGGRRHVDGDADGRGRGRARRQRGEADRCAATTPSA